MNWEKTGPSQQALDAFAKITDEEEFPDSYSGQAWRAAYRIWKVYKDKPTELSNCDPYSTPKGVDLKGLDLTGFMFGWAMNAVRQMLGMKAGPNPAIVTLGEKQEDYPSVGPAEIALKDALGETGNA
jgi:hypothetical protein